MKVTRLFRYPVKSLPGLAVDSMTLDDFGPAGDRRWMIVDPKNRFVTQRKYPQLARVSLCETDAGVEVEFPGHGRHLLKAGSPTRAVTVWRDQMSACEAVGTASQALSRWLDVPLSFVYMPESTFRQVDRHFVPDRRRLSFADGYPLLVVNQASLDQLSDWVGRPMDVRRFRPGIVLGGDQPFQEDGWRALKLATLSIDLVKPCGRCVMTTVDPDLGTRDESGEPLKTLTRLRPSEYGPLFGVNGVHSGEGVVRVGDEIAPVGV